MAISVEGIDAVIEMLEKVSPETVNAAVGQACAIVERTAKETAPKGTGELRRSITSKVETSGSAVKGTVYTPLEYAPYVEFGTGIFSSTGNGRKDVPWHYKDEKGNWHTTSGMSPRPYLIPALKSNRDKIISTIKEGLTK